MLPIKIKKKIKKNLCNVTSKVFKSKENESFKTVIASVPN